MPAERIWLDVPFSEKDEAKAHGARWDPAVKRWYAPRPGMTDLERWTAQAEVPDLLPGEDLSYGSGLFVDLVPSSCWFTNVRSCVSERDWERLRRMITRRAGYRCEACDRGADRDSRRWLEAHERWAYDERALMQTLRRLVCLCTDCHTATHIGLAGLKGKGAEAEAHLATVTGMSAREVERHVADAFSEWRGRSAMQWALDLSILTDAGITLRTPPGPAQRRQAAADGLTPLDPWSGI